VNIVANAFVLPNQSLLPFDEVSEPLYVVPPALSLSLRGTGEPLSVDAVLECDRLWGY
jgi:hypothetical protein